MQWVCTLILLTDGVMHGNSNIKCKWMFTNHMRTFQASKSLYTITRMKCCSLLIKYNLCFYKVKVKIKQSRNRRGVAQRVAGDLGSQISMTFSTWKWLRLSASRNGRLYPQEMFLVLILSRSWVDPQGHGTVGRIMSLKKIQWHHRESIPGPSG